VVVRLTPAAYLRTSVLDAKGAPVPKVAALVTLHGEYGTRLSLVAGRSDEQGTIVTSPLPSGVALSIEPASEVSHLTLNSAWWEEPHRTLKLKPGETYELPPLKIAPDGRTVSGLVVDAEDRPVAGAKVIGYRPMMAAEPTAADGQGRFTLSHLPVGENDAWLIASHPAQALYAMLKLPPETYAAVEVRVVLRVVLRPPVSVSGYLADREGRPLANVKLRVQGLLEARQAMHTMVMSWPAAFIPQPEAVTTGDDGWFTITGLVAGGGYMARAPRGYYVERLEFTANADGTPLDLGLVTIDRAMVLAPQ
jgi:hypothetical protein